MAHGPYRCLESFTAYACDLVYPPNGGYSIYMSDANTNLDRLIHRGHIADVLKGQVLSVYAELTHPSWCTADSHPSDLLTAVNNLREHHGNHPIDDCEQAVSWGAYLTAEGSDDKSPRAITRREGDEQRASSLLWDDGDPQD